MFTFSKQTASTFLYYVFLLIFMLFMFMFQMYKMQTGMLIIAVTIKYSASLEEKTR